jgi:hypothetical protein
LLGKTYNIAKPDPFALAMLWYMISLDPLLNIAKPIPSSCGTVTVAVKPNETQNSTQDSTSSVSKMGVILLITTSPFKIGASLELVATTAPANSKAPIENRIIGLLITHPGTNRGNLV